MKHEVEFEESALEDLSQAVFFEMRFIPSLDEALNRIDAVIDMIIEKLSLFPESNPERAYGFTDTLRRKCSADRYSAFYWVDETDGIVHVERVLHSKSDFGNIHFGN